VAGFGAITSVLKSSMVKVKVKVNVDLYSTSS